MEKNLPVLKRDLLPSSPSRLLVMDTVLRIPGSKDVVKEALLRARDLTMMQAFNAPERELRRVRKFVRAGGGWEGRLVLKNMVKRPGSMLSVMEVAYEGYGQGEVGGGRDAVGQSG